MPTIITSEQFSDVQLLYIKCLPCWFCFGTKLFDVSAAFGEQRAKEGVHSLTEVNWI